MIKASAAALAMVTVLAQAQATGCPDKKSAPPAPPSIPTAAATPAPPAATPPPTQVADLFATTVRPVVQAHCAPCHEPGGKMYARLPFDDPKVLSSHSEGVLRRLKGEDKEAFQRWVASLSQQSTVNSRQ
ncbi:MAG TPA: hypothetical protein VKH43_12500 [Thermoanaerobaculia bacterium]|nr:hypothetical protein [Thermoanaerobaculia bacterium]